MGTYKAQNSFVTGELSDAIWGRVDLDKYLSGAASIKNFVIQPWGGLTRRGGTYFGWEVKDSSKITRIEAFTFANGNSYLLEIGDQYIRFAKEGALITDAGDNIELSTPYLEADLDDLKFIRKAGSLWILHQDYATRKITYFSDLEWYLQPITFVDGPYLAVNIKATELVSSAATGAGATVTASSPVSVINAEAGEYEIISGGVPSNPNYVKITTDYRHGLESGDTLDISGIVGTTEANGTFQVVVTSGVTFELVGSNFVNAYVSGGTITPHLFAATDVGRALRIWNASASTWGYGEIVGYTSESVVTADIVDGSYPTSATSQWKLGKYSDTTGWPPVGILHEQRIGYAGSPAAPIDIDFSQTGLTDWFQVAIDPSEILASDAISYTLESSENNTIRWMLPVRGGLAIGTQGSVWLMSGVGSQDTPLSATDLPNAREHVGVGVAAISPAKASKAALFVDYSRRRLHEFSYLFEDDSYQAPDMTILVDHLTRDTKFKRISYQKSERVVWCAMDDGSLNSFTYMRAEGVAGWARHETDNGNFLDVTSASEGDRDVTYFIIEREIDGSTVKYVEYMADRFRGTEIEDGFFVDCGISGTGSGLTTISGLGHLEGQMVTAVGDGKLIPEQEVVGGEISLPYGVDSYFVGLNYTSRLESLPLEIDDARTGSSIGRIKSLDRILARIYLSYYFRAGVIVNQVEGYIDEITFSEDAHFDLAPDLFTGEKGNYLECDYGTDVRYVIETDRPAPLNISAVVVEYNLEKS